MPSQRIFLSWSGQKSEKVARALADWFRDILPAADPFLSSDIELGARWNTVLAQALATSSFGIFCITPDNLRAPWIMFEAGAVSKSLGARAVPLLFWCDANALEGPLRQFQAKEFTRGTLKTLTQTIADTYNTPWETISNTFTTSWDALRDTIDDFKSLQIPPVLHIDKGDRHYVPPYSDICDITEQQIMQCIARSAISQDAQPKIAYKALQMYLGAQCMGEDNVLDFVFGVLNRTVKDEPFVRENHREHIKLDVPNPHIDSERKWYQRQCLKRHRYVTYDVRKMDDQHSRYHFIVGPTCKVDDPWLSDFLDDFAYRVKVNSEVVFEWSAILPQISVDTLKKDGTIGTDTCTLRVDGGVLYINVNMDISLPRRTNLFVVEETSFLRYDENYYHFSLRHPTRDLQFDAKLGAGLDKWAFGEPDVGPRKYYPREGKNAPSVQYAANEVSVHVPTWVLPGIVLVLEWSYPMNVGETFALLSGATLPDRV